jgi:hypothetical protein
MCKCENPDAPTKASGVRSDDSEEISDSVRDTDRKSKIRIAASGRRHVQIFKYANVKNAGPE